MHSTCPPWSSGTPRQRSSLETTAIRWLGLGAALLLGASCSRAQENKSERRPAASATLGASASSALQRPPRRDVEAFGRNTGTQAPSGLAAVSAEQLLSTIRVSSARGTIVNVWASWCGPCRKEIPMLAALARNLSQDGIRVILVSADEPEDTDKALAFLKSAEVELPSYLAARPLGAFKVGLNPRWPGMVPATFLFDASAKLRYFWGGPVYEHEVLRVVSDLLANTLVDGEADFTVAPGKVER